MDATPKQRMVAESIAANLKKQTPPGITASEEKDWMLVTVQCVREAIFREFQHIQAIGNQHGPR
jgi:hypothetical protein